jgi:hypothetical protein
MPKIAAQVHALFFDTSFVTPGVEQISPPTAGYTRSDALQDLHASARSFIPRECTSEAGS